MTDFNDADEWNKENLKKCKFAKKCEYYNRDGYINQEYEYKRPTKHTTRKQFLEENDRSSFTWYVPMLDILFDNVNYTNN